MKKILSLLLVSLFVLVSCGSKAPVDIINPDAEYLYFFGATCPHCQELNRIAEERDLYSQIPVEKREVYQNPENREIFLQLIEEIQPDSDGVPFVYDKVTGEVAVWVRPALEMMTSRLNKSTTTTTQEAEAVENDESETVESAQVEETSSWSAN